MVKQTVQKGFTNGVNAAASPTLNDDQTLNKAVGLVQRRRGRYTSCWEGRSAATVNGSAAEFPGISRHTPSNILLALRAKIAGWYDASDSKYYTVSGGNYTALQDRMGLMSDLDTVSTGGTYGAMTQETLANGLTCMGSSSHRGFIQGSTNTTNTLLDSFTNGIAAFYAVYTDLDVTPEANAYAYYIDGATASTVDEVLFAYNSQSLLCYNDNRTTSSGNSTGALGVADEGQWNVHGYILESTGDVAVWKNGVKSTDTGVGALPDSNFGHAGMGFSQNGKIGEVIFLEADSMTDADATLISEYLAVKWGPTAYVAASGDIEVGKPPHRLMHSSRSGHLIASDEDGTTCTNGVNSVIYRGDGAVQAHEYGDYVFFFSAGNPIYAVHKDEIDDSQSDTVGAGGVWNDISEEFAVSGRGIFLSHEYHELGILAGSSSAKLLQQSGATNIRFTTGNAGNDAWHRAGNVTITGGAGHLHLSKSRVGMLENQLPERGHFFDVTSNTTMDVREDQTFTFDEIVYRAVVPGQWAMGRFPFTYKGRLCYIEGREYETGYLLEGAGVTVNTSGPTGSQFFVRVLADLTNNDINIGDEVILAPSTYLDPILFTPDNIETHTITGMSVTTGASTDLVFDTSTASAAGWHWWIRRKLTPRQKRQIWPTGRPADPNRKTITSREDQDPFFLYSGNETPWGDDDNGDVTAVMPVGRNSIFLSQERALYVLTGELPVDGVTKPGFSVNLVKSGIGVRNDACWTFGGSQEHVFFNDGVEDRVYLLQGGEATPIDGDVLNDATYTGVFSHLAFHNNRLYCFDSVNKRIWMFDTILQKWLGYTERKGCGTNQTGDGTAVEAGVGEVGTWAASTAYSVDDMINDGANIQVCTTAGTSNGSEPTWATTNGTTTTDNTVTWTCYKATELYDTSAGHGGIFQPFNVDGESKRLLVAYRATDGDFELRTMNHDDDYHLDARLRHGAILTPSETTMGGKPIQATEIRYTLYERIVKDADAGSPVAHENTKVDLSVSEGQSVETFYNSADWTDDQTETVTHRHFLGTSRGSAGIGISIGDGIAPIAECEVIEVDVKERGS